MRRLPRFHRPGPFLLMAASLALLGVISLLGYLAHARHQRTAIGLLRDYSAVAAWNYRQRAVADLRHGLHMQLHSAHTGTTVARGRRLKSLPEAAQAARQCGCPLGPPPLLHMVYSTRRDSLLTNAPLPPGVTQALLQERLLAAPLPPQHNAVEVVPLRRGHLLAVTVGEAVDGDRLVFGAVFSISSLAPLLQHAFVDATLLPPTLTRGRSAHELIALQVRHRDLDEPVFASSGSMQPLAVDTFAAPFGAFTAGVSIEPAAAALFVTGGTPRSGLPLFAALFLVAAALTWLASLQLLRERRFVDARERFVTSVSHELRTPLAQMQLFVDTLQMGRAASADERDWALSQIGSETTRLRHLVENVLYVARGERANGGPVPVLDCAAALREVAGAMAPLLAQRSARLATELSEDVRVRIQPEHLRQILLNLLDNAAKFGPSGQTIRMRLRAVDGQARIIVQDEGPGVAPDETARIWERFVRASAADATGTGGTGIGLAIVRELVERYGGSVSVTPGVPCRFEVRLPLVTSDVTAPAGA